MTLENTKVHVTAMKYVWVIDQAWGQDGRIFAKFFSLHVYGQRVKIHKLANIKPSWPKQASSKKDLL